MRRADLARALAWLNLGLAGLAGTVLVRGQNAGPYGGATPFAWVTRAYGVELFALGALVLLGSYGRGPAALAVIGACLGALATFSFLGMWSIGIALVPSVILTLTIGRIASRQPPSSLKLLVVWTVVGVVCQALLMLGVLQMMRTRG